jgi:hypothetical protein
MRTSNSALRIATLVFATAVAGCASTGSRRSPAGLCQPQQCYVDVQNDIGVLIGVRYYDSTGVGDLLGSVRAGSIQRFPLSRRTSRTITIEVSDGVTAYRAQATMSLPPRENVIHFPTDFQTSSTR